MDRGKPLRVEKPAIFTLASAIARESNTISPGNKGAKVEFYRISKWLAEPLKERALDKLTPVDFATRRNKRQKSFSGAAVNREISRWKPETDGSSTMIAWQLQASRRVPLPTFLPLGHPAVVVQRYAGDLSTH